MKKQATPGAKGGDIGLPGAAANQAYALGFPRRRSRRLGKLELSCMGSDCQNVTLLER